MPRRILAFVILAALAAAASPAANAETRVYRTPGHVERPSACAGTEAAEAAADAPELAGGPAAAARPTRTWSVRSSHVPADVEPAFAPPVAIILDIDADDPRARSGPRRPHRPRGGRR